MTTETTQAPFEGWAILEIMGHRTRPGFVKEVEMAGGKMIRVDIPISESDHVTEFYGVQAIYSLRPSTEELVRKEISTSYGMDPRPIRPLDYKEREQLSLQYETPQNQTHDGDDERPF